MEHVRGTIVAGRLKPGDRLPTRGEFAGRFKTTAVTVQRAFDRLVEEGFVTVSGNRGTFVSAHPPNASRYALVFPGAPGRQGWVKFWTVLQNVAFKMERGDELRIPTYLDTERLEGSPDYLRLQDDVRAHRVAGIIFSSNPSAFDGTPVATNAAFARVALMGPPLRPGIPAVSFGPPKRFFERAAEWLAGKKRRRVAAITVPGFAEGHLEGLHEAAGKNGLACRPHQVLFGHQGSPEGSSQLARVLMHLPRRERPDALIVTDDNLTEQVCAGLRQEGVRVGKDIDVVAHCNFPPPAPSAVPIARLGYDIRGVLETCIGILDVQRAGRKPRALTNIEPVFEWETPSGKRNEGLA
jgi:hypothetical protein